MNEQDGPEYVGNPNGYVQRESDAAYVKPDAGSMHEPKPYTGELDWYDLAQRPETD